MPQSTKKIHSKAKAATSKPVPPGPGYQALKAELDTIMTELQREDLDVDAALRYYQRGLELIQQLQHYLKTAENKLTELTAQAGPTGQ